MLLQHPDGRLALERGDVDAWAGLDPMMAATEVEAGAVLFYRKPEANTWGILNVREEFAKKNPELVSRVLAVYEEARRWSLANPQALKQTFAGFTKLPPAVVDRQIDTRTELTHSVIGEPQRESILAAGLALRDAGVLPAEHRREGRGRRPHRCALSLQGDQLTLSVLMADLAAPAEARSQHRAGASSGASAFGLAPGVKWGLGLVLPLALALGWEAAVRLGPRRRPADAAAEPDRGDAVWARSDRRAVDPRLGDAVARRGRLRPRRR